MFAFLPQGPGAARWSCAYFFAICGVAYGSVMSRMPAIKADVGLNDAELGSALLCLGLGALTAFLIAGWIQTRIGSRRVQIAGGLGLLLTFPLLGLPGHLWSLALAFYIMGVTNGTTEVAMGTQAILVERAVGKPRLSSLHAMYSLGGLVGSLGGALLIGLPPFLHFSLAAAIMLCLLPFASARLLDDKPAPSEKRKGRRLPPRLVVLLGVLALCCYASEGAIGDWGALLLHSIKGASQQTAALAYAAFSAAMVIGRLAGDRLRAEFGDYCLMRALAVIATCGSLIVLFVPWPGVSLAGYALMGVGLSVIVPMVFSAVGRVRGFSTSASVAVVSSMGFGGLLIAPPLIGMLAQLVGLQEALLVVAVLCGSLIAGAKLVKR